MSEAIRLHMRGLSQSLTLYIRTSSFGMSGMWTKTQNSEENDITNNLYNDGGNSFISMHVHV